jgi:hypothetical protein
MEDVSKLVGSGALVLMVLTLVVAMAAQEGNGTWKGRNGTWEGNTTALGKMGLGMREGGSGWFVFFWRRSILKHQCVVRSLLCIGQHRVECVWAEEDKTAFRTWISI